MTSPKRVALGLIFTLILEAFFPLIGSIEWHTTYAYGTETKAIAAMDSVNTLGFRDPMTSFVVKIRTSTEIENEDDVIVTVSNGKVTKEASLELEWDEMLTGTYFTAPVHFAPTDKVSVRIETKKALKDAESEVIALDTVSGTSRLTLNPDKLTANAATGTKIVSRAEWGADETLRYKDHATWKKYYENLEKNKDQPVSEATKKYEERIKSISASLRTKFPEEFELSEVRNSENGHELVWPIEKTKKVRKIVLHHTAENLLSDSTDESLIRSMYYYHTITRGWGDLGYNYIVGQRGVIYEGRAGGDYSVGAHAAWNNSSTVGISVIGNFEKDNVNRDQETGIKQAITYLSNKYGINLNSKVMGHKECKSSPECLTTDNESLALVWHRDVGYTACPGTNLYSKLTAFRDDLWDQTKTYKLVSNPVYKPETLPENKQVQIAASSASKGPNIRIKLSTPTDWKQLRLEAVEGKPVLQFDKTNGSIKSNSIVIKKKGLAKVELVLDGKRYTGKTAALSADLVRIATWDRKPAWDTSGKYNDNVFRGKIEVRVTWGKLEVINELPLEDYLKGLAEISNGDNPEKVKTILVAARSYALWYTDPKNRKFPGKDYDGSDDPDVFQKYLGYGYETRSGQVAKLVDSTRGQVVTYAGALIKPWYFNESDGRTRSAKEYCESNGGKACQDIPYLQSVDDPGSAGKTRKGHGVGVSWTGATYFAVQKGWDFETILKYYLVGTKVEKKY